jgi:diguanylate cyclase (GGDEF)-like protein/PAS domain S-box-containing protein
MNYFSIALTASLLTIGGAWWPLAMVWGGAAAWPGGDRHPPHVFTHSSEQTLEARAVPLNERPVEAVGHRFTGQTVEMRPTRKPATPASWEDRPPFKGDPLAELPSSQPTYLAILKTAPETTVDPSWLDLGLAATATSRWADRGRWVLPPLLAGVGGLLIAVIVWNRRLQQEIHRCQQTKTALADLKESLRRSEDMKRQILESIPDLLVWMTVDGTCIGVAGGGTMKSLYKAEDMVGRNQYEILPPTIAVTRRQTIEAVSQTGQMQLYEQHVEIDGHLQYEEVRVVPIEADTVLVIIRNVSDRKLAELALAESEKRYRLVTENMTDLVCLHRPDGRFVYVTPSCQTLLGYSQAELIDQSPYPFFHPEDQDRIRDAHQMALAGDRLPVTGRFRHHYGHYIWLETLTQPICDAKGQVIHLQTTSRDVSDRVAIEQRLRHDALHDSLTNLPNRVMLTERLELALKRTKRQPDYQFAVLFVDCDQFKVINDSLGHAVGDQLLTAIAQKFSRSIRDTDLVARLSSDEFVFLLETIDSINDAVQVAKRILADMRSPFLIKGQEIFISASIGIVLGTTDHGQADTLIRNADIAMYRAKSSGRSTYAIFDPDMHTRMVQYLKLENDLRTAIKNQEFVLFYQPVVSLKTLRIVGFETLLRWQHPVLGLLTPDKFIDIAEATDLIQPLGEWILLTACQQMGTWQSRLASPDRLTLNVNLSVKQLQESVLVPQLQKVLTHTRIDPQTLTLEITESLLVTNIHLTSQLLNQVQAMGVSISIDDFGTGYSSLSYLHQLPVNSLKVDRTFVSPSEPNPKNQTIAESIIGLSNLLNLHAIAEGIETPQQLAWLRSLQCEYGQGYFFSKPLPAREAESLLYVTQPFTVDQN